MSKAFTKDEGAAGEGPLRAPLRSSGRRLMTPEGFARLQDELRALEEQRVSLRADSSVEAAARVRDVEARMEQLHEVLDAADVQTPQVDPRGRALFGSWVDVEDEDAELTTYRLVGPDEADAKAGLLSVHGPIGRALLGRAAGESVLVQIPKGEVELTLVRVRYSESDS